MLTNKWCLLSVWNSNVHWIKVYTSIRKKTTSPRMFKFPTVNNVMSKVLCCKKWFEKKKKKITIFSWIFTRTVGGPVNDLNSQKFLITCIFAIAPFFCEVWKLERSRCWILFRKPIFFLVRDFDDEEGWICIFIFQ